VVGILFALALRVVKGVLSLAALFDGDDLLGENTRRIDLDSSALSRQDHVFRAAQPIGVAMSCWISEALSARL
jgi:hypothetical protein